MEINFLQGPVGEQSSMRLITLLVFGSFLIVWMYLSLKNGVLQPIPQDVLSLLEYILIGKVGQSALVESGLMKNITGKFTKNTDKNKDEQITN